MYFLWFVDQVWTSLDLHNLNICGSFDWHICDLCRTQDTEKIMELWHKFGDVVWCFVLRLCHYCSALLVYNPQILFCPYWPRSAALPLWVLTFYLHSCLGKVYRSQFFILLLRELCGFHAFIEFNGQCKFCLEVYKLNPNT